MRLPFRDHRRPLFIAPLVVAALGVAPAASAEVYKCAEKNGLDRYQNFPCAIDSPGWMPESRPMPKAPVMGAAGQDSKSAPAVVAETGKSPRARDPRVGMSPNEVKEIWGEPAETDQDERKEGRIDIWRYADGRSVEFSHKQRVLTVQR